MTPRRRKFVAAMIGEANGNQTEAARLAGFKQPEMEGSRLMRIDEVSAAVEEGLKPILEEFSNDDVKRLFISHAKADLGKYLEVVWACEECGRNDIRIDLEAIKADGATYLIKKIKTNQKTGETTIEFHDSQAAGDKLARIYGMYRAIGKEDEDSVAMLLHRMITANQEDAPQP